MDLGVFHFSFVFIIMLNKEKDFFVLCEIEDATSYFQKKMVVYVYIYEEIFEVVQISKYIDGLGLGTYLFIIKFFLLGSKSLALLPGFLLQQKVIASLSLRLSLN